MSADRDDNHSESLDVAERKSSNSIPPGDGGGMRESSTENIAASTIPSSSPSSRARGDVGRSSGRMNSRPKTRKGPIDSTLQSHKTLMRTHSAPPDEHAGINFSGIGARASAAKPYSQVSGSFPTSQGPPLKGKSPQSTQSNDGTSSVPMKEESGVGSEVSGDAVPLTSPASGFLSSRDTSRDTHSQPGNQQQHRQSYISPDMRGMGGYPRPSHLHLPHSGAVPTHVQPNGMPDQRTNKHKASTPIPSNLSPRTAAPSIQGGMGPSSQKYAYPPHRQQQQQPHHPHMQHPAAQMMPQGMQPPRPYVPMMFYPTQQHPQPGMQPQMGYPPNDMMQNGMMQMQGVGMGMGHILNRSGMQSHGDLRGAATRAPPMYMSGDVRQQHLQALPLPPAPPVQTFSVQQQQQQHQQAQGQQPMHTQHMIPQHQHQNIGLSRQYQTHMPQLPQQFMSQQMQAGTPVVQTMGQGHLQTGRTNTDLKKKRPLVLKDKHGNVISLCELKGPGDGSASGSTPSSVSSSPHLAAAKTSPAMASATASTGAPPLQTPVLALPTAAITSAVPSSDVPPPPVMKTVDPLCQNSPTSSISSTDQLTAGSQQLTDIGGCDNSPKSTALLNRISTHSTANAVKPDVHSMSSSLVITPPDGEDDHIDGDSVTSVSDGSNSSKPLSDADTPLSASNIINPCKKDMSPDTFVVEGPDSQPAESSQQPCLTDDTPQATAGNQSLLSTTPPQPAAATVPQAKPVVAAPHVMPVGTLVIESPEDDDQAENSQHSQTSAPLQDSGGVSAADKKSKKSLRKEKIAAADLPRDVGSDMLDAYTSAPQKVLPTVAANAHAQTEAAEVVHASPVEVKTGAAKPEADPEDDWETQALKIADEDIGQATITPEPVVRSLRPGGGSSTAKLGTNAKPPPKLASLVYRKGELLRLRGSLDQLQRPDKFFENIVVFGPDNQPLPRGTYGTKSPQQLQQQYYGGQQVDPRYCRGAPPQLPPPHQQHQHIYPPPGGMNATGLLAHQSVDEGKPNWKRGTNQGRKGRQPAPPMPRKVITDPVEAMTREVISILNKITPQTFLKLTHKLAEIETSNSAMLEKLIQLVVDKAIGEPTFSHLYAEMVSILDAENNYLTFCHVVWNKDSNQYFWIRDLPFSNTLVGPFQSSEECIDASQAQILPMAVPVSHAILKELVVVNGILVNVFKNGDRDEYYFTAMPLADVDTKAMSGACYSSKEAAWKSATKKHAFVKMLVKICQAEYLASTENTGFYAIPGERRERLNRERGQISEDEVALAMFEIEELEGGAKRRMMGNVRFIGELCKKGIIKTNIMHDCIRDLLSRPTIDEQMLELVCKLLRTVGQLLEDTASGDQKLNFESYFAKLAELAANKQVGSRVRFSMDEIISLRRNNWQERRESDGPALLEEIRMKAASEEQMKRTMQHQQLQNAGRGRGGRGTGGRGNVQQHHYQQQQQQHYDPRTSLTRNSSAGPGSTTSSNHRGSPTAAGNYGGTEIRRFISEPTAAVIPRDSQIDTRRHDCPSSNGNITPPRPDSDSMDAKLASRKARNIIDEYLQLRDNKEAFECLAELPASVCGDFVVTFVDKFLYCNKDDIKGILSSLMEVVMPLLQTAQVHVESSLAKCEAILQLLDTVVDVKNAPEMLGSIVGQLIRGGACRLQLIDQILSDVRKANSEDEFGYSDEEVAGIHGRFRSTFA